MRLLQLEEDGTFNITKNLPDGTFPKYAILSHTWMADDEQEVTFQDLMQQVPVAATKPEGYDKIRFCGEQAAKDGLEYFWVDTCCIDKSSSAEVQEAISTMFSFYRASSACYVYLTDVSVPQVQITSASNWESAFRRSKWFTRGWTLQELLAPTSVEFFSVEGTRLGDRRSLERWIQEISGIPQRALRGEDMSAFTITERLSWSEKRQTKRNEDRAYCLLGIFGIFMPLLYGEGDCAFTRLREEIRKKQEQDIHMDEILATLPVASDAAFDSPNNQHEPTCLPNTRAEIFQHMAEWVDGRDQRCVFWLSGVPGTGKSTVARTIARTYHKLGFLGGDFFFSRGGGDRSNASKLITTLARQLASRLPAIRSFIYHATMEHSNIMERSLRDQWEQLILRPLSQLGGRPSRSTIVFVIDAMDECSSEGDISSILGIMATVHMVTNLHLRIFITSRPEIAIRHGKFGKTPHDEREIFVVHEISPTMVDQDLGLFFEYSFSNIREERGFAKDWPGRKNIKRLVDISSGLFISASTVCRFICEGRQPAMGRVEILINGSCSGMGPEAQLDQIYTTVLRNTILLGRLS